METEEFEKKTCDALCKSMDEHPEDWIIDDKDDKRIEEYCMLKRKDGLVIWCYLTCNEHIYKPNEYKFQNKEYQSQFSIAVRNLKQRIFNERQRQLRLKRDADLEKTQDNLCNMLGINTLKDERKEKLEHLGLSKTSKIEGNVKRFLKKLFS